MSPIRYRSLTLSFSFCTKQCYFHNWALLNQFNRSLVSATSSSCDTKNGDCMFRGPVFSMGQSTLSVPMKLFALNRERLCDSLRSIKDVPEDAVVILKGGNSVSLYSSDVEYNVFRQEAFFFWAFGVTEPGFYGAIQVSTGSTFLFAPKFPDAYEVWMGRLHTLEQYEAKYAVDKVFYKTEVVEVLKNIPTKTLLTLNGTNTDSGLKTEEVKFDGISEFNVVNNVLHHVMSECRVKKTDIEKEVMRYAGLISSEAHKEVMKVAKPGMYEYHYESTFLHHAYFIGGCRHVGYTCICASGENAAVLHYGHAAKPNNKCVLDGDLCLFDMGAVYCGYTADVTVTFPANGKFTEDQKNIYNAVLAANLAVQKSAKPGVSWVDMHRLANKVMLEELKKLDLVVGEVDDMIKDGIAAVFQPHGLGHLLGLDVHDVGGYLKGTPERPAEPGFSSLRTARVLEEGMALTIEPGCYFIDSVLDKALANPVQSKYINPEVLSRFRGFGGVRIEDDVFVTKDGIENYTKVPRTVEEIENWMSQRKENGV